MEPLDKVVADFVSGGIAKLGEFAAEAARIVGELKGEAEAAAGKYYLRVFEKLQANAGYVEKEAARLGGMLEKGALAGLKRDELKRKLNVLRKFLTPADGEDEADAKDEL